MLNKDETLQSSLAVLKFKPGMLQLARLGRRGKGGRTEEEGRPLDAALREEMENLLGCDFRDVRIYDERKAEEMACRLNAEAFTIGSKIFAAKGKLDSTTSAGKALLAHELTHVAQETQQAYWGAIDRPLPSWTAIHSAPRPEVPQTASSSRDMNSGDAQRQEKEREAQTVERLVREGSGARLLRTERSSSQTQETDPEDIADRVYRLMQSELILERERARI